LGLAWRGNHILQFPLHRQSRIARCPGGGWPTIGLGRRVMISGAGLKLLWPEHIARRFFKYKSNPDAG
jgi:hypothetical protein